MPFTQTYQALIAIVFDSQGMAFVIASEVAGGAFPAPAAAVRMRFFPGFSRRYSGYDPGPGRP
jgi:hypothetical protein